MKNKLLLHPCCSDSPSPDPFKHRICLQAGVDGPAMPFGSRLLVYSSMLLFSFEDCGPPGLPRMLQLDLVMRPDVHAALIAVHDSARWLEAVPCKSCAPVLLPVAALCFRVSCACSDALLPSLGMAHEEDHCQGNGLGLKIPCLQGHLTCLAACSVAAPSPPPAPPSLSAC